MTVAVVYVCPVEAHGADHQDFALRFIATWLAHSPDYQHDLIVVSNGGAPCPEVELAFEHIPTFKAFHVHDDSGWDIGAFQSVSSVLNHDVVVFFGGNAYFKKRGWLKRMMEAYHFHGPNLYGAFATAAPVPHIRTTGFWMPLELWRRYPWTIKTFEERYDFEHREKSITNWVQSQSRQALMVTWNGVWGPKKWSQVPGGYGGAGGCSECLIRDRISDFVHHQ